MTVPEGVWWEVIVVDNASQDTTQKVIAQFVDRLPLRSSIEAKRGVSNARNHLLDIALGDYLLWIDDDVLVATNWLQAYAQAITTYSTTAIFGGPIEPVFIGEPPRWLRQIVSIVPAPFGYLDIAALPIEFDRETKQLPWGSNYGIRATAYRGNRYNPNLGPGAVAALYDETDLVQRILATGQTGAWVPSATVQHVIGKERQTVTYIRKYYQIFGRTQVYLNRADIEGPRKLFGVPRWMWRSVVQKELGYWLKRVTAPPEVWAERLRDAAIQQGILQATREHNRRNARSKSRIFG